MRAFEFPDEVLARIEHDRFEHADPAVRRRMEMLWLKAHGEKHERIAELSGVTRPTVQRVLDLYEEGGLSNGSYITATTVCELLVKLQALNLAMPITLVLDNARYQRCRLVQEMAQTLHIELLFLPSYSPNLNLIERLWKFVKKTALNSRPHASFAEFRDAIDQCLDELPTTHQLTMATLMTPTFQTFENVSKLAA